MDIVLVDNVSFGLNGFSIAPQLGLVSLHNRLKHKFSVDLIDFDYMSIKKEYTYDDDKNVAINHMAEYLAQKNALIYGFYTMCNTYHTTILTAKRLKQLRPDAKIIFGGPHATMTAEESLNSFSFIDAIGIGEAERYICDFVQVLISGGNLNEVKGLCFRDKGKIVFTEVPELLGDDELSEMNLADMLRDCDNIFKCDSTSSDSEYLLEGGRGCPFSCTFCSTNEFWKRRYRIKSIKSLIQEMKDLHTEYGHTMFGFNHDHFTFNKEYLHEFCNELIEEDLKFKWGCSSRIDTLNYESIELMKKAGCTNIFVGIETGSKRMQQNIHKNLNLEDALNKIIYIKNQGIVVIVSFIYGFPDENPEDFSDTMGMMDKLLLNNIRNLQLHKLMPLPRTKELEKVSDKMFFDEGDIELSIYKENTMPPSFMELIKEHSYIFSQFHTFDSEVRTKYKRMDFFIYFLIALYKEAYMSIKFLLNKYGSVGLYDLVRDEIDIALDRMKSDGLNPFEKETMKTYKELYTAVIDRIRKIEDDDYFHKVIIFDLQKVFMIEVKNEAV